MQGFGQLEGIESITDLENGFVFDLDKARAKALVEKANAKFGIQLQQTSRIEDLYDVDIICTATTSSKPILFGDKLKLGIHLNAVGSNAPNRQEIHETVLLKSKVYVDRKEQALKEAGDLVIPIRQGLYKPESIAGELCDVVTSKIKGRTSDSEVTVFKSVGLALEDIAVAHAVFVNAVKKGVGLEMDFQSSVQ